ncbi:hypothetical protein PIB30_074951 [Stylosanthes scabra]|uniref:Uncharacterized protein n=1 Tax=Stylosanthes scabra TaxID=79078 RepID=A0ABU6ZNJ9_9FABA|nr:hypothetical protein [Stylosanthes scabra]
MQKRRLLLDRVDVNQQLNQAKMGKSNVEKKSKAAAKPVKKKNSVKDGHEFRCLPKTVAQMFIYLKDHLDKRPLVDEMGLGALSYLPNKYLNQRLLKQIYDRYDIYDNTIYSDAAASDECRSLVAIDFNDAAGAFFFFEAGGNIVEEDTATTAAEVQSKADRRPVRDNSDDSVSHAMV